MSSRRHFTMCHCGCGAHSQRALLVPEVHVGWERTDWKNYLEKPVEYITSGSGNSCATVFLKARRVFYGNTTVLFSYRAVAGAYQRKDTELCSPFLWVYIVDAQRRAVRFVHRIRNPLLPPSPVSAFGPLCLYYILTIWLACNYVTWTQAEMKIYFVLVWNYVLRVL